LYDGKQVLRVEAKYKQNDLYNIGVEMSSRKGTGNYDSERVIYNVEYVSITERNLYQEVKKKLKDRNIEYLNRPNTNMLNGITFTSGSEFFESLGMKFIDSGRIYKTGDKKGQIVKVPYIKSKDDIPHSITRFFDCCMEFLRQYVGEENIVLAQVHYDEDTPHLQAYFLPIVNEVKRKCFVKDNLGNLIKEEIKTKDNKTTLVPKLLRDDKGKIIYEKVKGNFLNNDQFWKDRGGKNSYAIMQDEFNKFITSKCFNLDRGNIGSSKVHQSKLEYDINEKKAELEELTKECENVSNTLKQSKEAIENANKPLKSSLLDIKKGLFGYKDSDVIDIISYTKGLRKVYVIQENQLREKDETIKKLSIENNLFRNSNILFDKTKFINKQKEEIERLTDLVDSLTKKIEDIKEKFEKEINKWKNLFKKLCSAIDKVLNKEPEVNLEDYEVVADNILNEGKVLENDDYDLEI